VESDEGKYECVAQNSAGIAYSYPANLAVHGTSVTAVGYMIQVRYRKSPRDTCRTVKLKLTLTLVLTLTDTGGAVLTLMLGYRSLYITWQ